MKKQIALALAGTAAAIAGGLRLIQELVEHGDRGQPETGAPERGSPSEKPDGATKAAAPPTTSPSPAEAAPSDKAPEEPVADGGAGTHKTGSPGSSPKAPGNATKAELYEIATGLKISGRSKMSKAELIDAINAASR